MVIYSNRFVTISFHKETSMIELVYSEETADMKDQDFVKVVDHFVELMDQYQPTCFLADHSLLVYPIVPEVQDILLSKPRSNAQGVQINKMAFIASPDFIVQLSLVQLEQKGTAEGKMNTRTFKSRHEAIDWLLNN